MASFLDKVGVTTMWNTIKLYCGENYVREKHWNSPIQLKAYSKICKLSGYGNVLLNIYFSQNSQSSLHLYLISTGYGKANIIQLGANNYTNNANTQIRITQSTAQQPNNFDVEVLNNYAYGSATTLSLLIQATILNVGCGVIPYQTFTAGSGTVLKEITSSGTSFMDSFVKKAGDTMTGNLNISNSANNSHTQVYSSGNDGQGGIALIDSNGTIHDLRFFKDGNLTWQGNKVWHAGNDGSGSGLNADLLDGWHGSGTGGQTLKKSGYISTYTSGLLSYWCKIGSFTWQNNYDNRDVTLYIHSAYNDERGFVHINARRNTDTDINVYLKIISGNLNPEDFRLYYDSSLPTSVIELWGNVKRQYGVINTLVISETSRTSQEKPIITLYNTEFTTVQTPTLTTYVLAVNTGFGGSVSSTALTSISLYNTATRKDNLTIWKTACGPTPGETSGADGVLIDINTYDQSMQLFNAVGELWMRFNETTGVLPGGWESWRRILDSRNYSTVLDSVYVKKTELDSAIPSKNYIPETSSAYASDTYTHKILLNKTGWLLIECSLFSMDNSNLPWACVAVSTYIPGNSFLTDAIIECHTLCSNVDVTVSGVVKENGNYYLKLQSSIYDGLDGENTNITYIESKI